MNRLSDEEIQKRVEAMRREGAASHEGDESAQLYEQLFDELSVEPPIDLSLGFSRNIIRQIQRRQADRHQTTAYLLFGLVLVLALGIAFAFQATRSASDSTETWQALLSIKWPVLFLATLLALTQWADYRFVKSKHV